MPKPYLRKFRDHVVLMARNRDAGVTVGRIASDFGMYAVALSKWLLRADIDDGAKLGTTSSETFDIVHGDTHLDRAHWRTFHSPQIGSWAAP